MQIILKNVKLIFIFHLVGMLSFCGNSTDLLQEKGFINSNDSLAQSFDLFPNLKLASQNVPTSVQAGEVFTPSIAVANLSEVDVTYAFKLSAFIVNESNEHKIIQQNIIQYLASNDYFVINDAITVPSALPAGSFQFYAMIDSDNVIQEANESDNTSTTSLISITPRTSLTDLVPQFTNVTFPDGNLNGHVTIEIKNIGEADLNPELFKYSVYLSVSNSIFEPSVDELLYNGSSAQGQSYFGIPKDEIKIINLVIPGLKQTAPGAYNLIIQIDDTNLIPEISETNNVSTIAFQLII